MTPITFIAFAAVSPKKRGQLVAIPGSRSKTKKGGKQRKTMHNLHKVPLVPVWYAR